MATSIAYTIVYSMQYISNVVAIGGKELMKPGDYIALHLLNCVICAITIGVLYNIYFG
tara:strand:+ start:410 stop:583 length:174 start_codon:yes stop_codon:yes gene_type:complete